MKVDLDTLAPEERRLILVASEETYARLRTRIDWLATARSLATRLASLVTPATLIAPFVGDALARSGYLAPTWARASRASRAPSSLGEIAIPHVSPREAAARFRFDHGMPEDGAAYVLNPVRADHYVRPALINERLAQEKLAAFIRLASSLGAAEVEVESGEVVGREGAISVPLSEASGQIGLHVKGGGAITRQIVARFDPPDAPPHVSAELAAWLAIDPVLEGVARARLEGKLVEQTFALSFRDVVDVGARACVELEGKGIDVGGRYHALHASRWSFHIRFHRSP
jgi:hypothetical protein